MSPAPWKEKKFEPPSGQNPEYETGPMPLDKWRLTLKYNDNPFMN